MFPVEIVVSIAGISDLRARYFLGVLLGKIIAYIPSALNSILLRFWPFLYFLTPGLCLLY